MLSPRSSPASTGCRCGARSCRARTRRSRRTDEREVVTVRPTRTARGASPWPTDPRPCRPIVAAPRSTTRGGAMYGSPGTGPCRASTARTTPTSSCRSRSGHRSVPDENPTGMYRTTFQGCHVEGSPRIVLHVGGAERAVRVGERRPRSASARTPASRPSSTSPTSCGPRPGEPPHVRGGAVVRCPAT